MKNAQKTYCGETILPNDEYFMFYRNHHGKTVTVDGEDYKIQYSSHMAIYPYRHFVVNVTLDPPKNAEYYEIKSQLGDDWVISLNNDFCEETTILENKIRAILSE